MNSSFLRIIIVVAIWINYSSAMESNIVCDVKAPIASTASLALEYEIPEYIIKAWHDQKVGGVGGQVDFSLVDFVLGQDPQSHLNDDTANQSFQHNTLIITVPGANTPTCTTKHLPTIMNEYTWFVENNIRVLVLCPDSIDTAQAWGTSQKLTDNETPWTKCAYFLGDAARRLLPLLVSMQGDSNHRLGFFPQRAVLFVIDGILKARYEETTPGNVENSSFAKIQEVWRELLAYKRRKISSEEY